MADDSIVLVCGEDDYFITEEAKRVVAKHVPEAEREFGLEIIEGRCDTVDAMAACVKSALAPAQTAGFFGGKLTWVRDVTFLGAKRGADSATVKEAVAELVECVKQGLPEGQRLLVSGCGVSRAGAFFKACQKHGRVVDVGGAEKGYQKLKAMREMLPEFLEREGLKMSTQTREAFLNRVGADTRLVVQELAKLRTYLGKAGEATERDVNAVCSIGREAEAWDFLDAWSERQMNPTLESLTMLLDQGKNGVYLATMLETRVREMLVFRACVDAGWLEGTRWRADLPKEAEEVLRGMGTDPRGMNPWMAQKRATQAKKFSLRELRNARVLVMTLREQLVSTQLDERVLLEAFVVRTLRSGK
jgi:DNA polymerase-3 subunit delta